MDSLVDCAIPLILGVPYDDLKRLAERLQTEVRFHVDTLILYGQGLVKQPQFKAFYIPPETTSLGSMLVLGGSISSRAGR